jgi:hypothetical protein
VKEFADAFQSFHIGAALNAELSIPYDKKKCHPAALTTEEYGLSKMELFRACFDREVLLMKRSSFVYIFKAVQVKILHCWIFLCKTVRCFVGCFLVISKWFFVLL